MTVTRTAAPDAFRGGPPATERQIRFIQQLMSERELTEAQTADANDKLAAGLDKSKASEWIARLLVLPKKTSHTARFHPEFNRLMELVPEGDYAIALDPVTNDGQDIAFYRVRHGDKNTRWEGFIFLEVYASDERHPIRNPEAKLGIIRHIAADPRAAAVLFGLHKVRCGVCGRKLTHKESRDAGIGPVCADKRGWG